MTIEGMKRTLVIGLAAGLGFAGLTACEAPEDTEEPTAQAEAPQQDDQADELAPGDEAPALDQQEAPDELGGPAEGEQPPMMGGQQEFDEEVTDEELDQFGEAIEAMQELEEEGEDPQQRMQEADSQAEMQQIQQELMQEMQSAVEDSGMEFRNFMQLAQRLQQDPELQQRLAERVDMQELMGPGPDAPGAEQPAPGGQEPAPVEAPDQEADGPEADDGDDY